MDNNQENMVPVQEKSSKFLKLKRWVQKNKFKSIIILCVVAIVLSLIVDLIVSTVKEKQTPPPPKGETAVEKVEKMIRDLPSYGAYSLTYEEQTEWEKALADVEKAYTELSEAEKKEVENYERFQYNQGEYYYEVATSRAIKTAFASIRSVLKNPSSFIDEGTYTTIYYDASGEKILGAMATVCYSATNSFGGRVTDSYYFARVVDENGYFTTPNLSLVEFDNIMEENNAIKVKDYYDFFYKK